MADSIREQILKEIELRAKAVTELGGRVYRSRAQAASRAEMPALVITPFKDPAERVISICKVDRFLTVRFALIVKGDVPDQEADPILQSLHSKLLPPLPSGELDTSLGGIALDVSQAGDSFEFAFTEGVILADYVIQYRHSEGDLAS